MNTVFARSGNGLRLNIYNIIVCAWMDHREGTFLIRDISRLLGKYIALFPDICYTIFGELQLINSTGP